MLNVFYLTILNTYNDLKLQFCIPKDIKSSWIQMEIYIERYLEAGTIDIIHKYLRFKIVLYLTNFDVGYSI